MTVIVIVAAVVVVIIIIVLCNCVPFYFLLLYETHLTKIIWKIKIEFRLIEYRESHTHSEYEVHVFNVHHTLCDTYIVQCIKCAQFTIDRAFVTHHVSCIMYKQKTNTRAHNVIYLDEKYTFEHNTTEFLSNTCFARHTARVRAKYNNIFTWYSLY